MAAMYVSARRLNDPFNGYITGVRCFFRLLDLHAGQYWSPMEYMGWLGVQQKRFFACRTHVKSHGDLWTEFDHWLEEQVSQDSYIVYKRRNESVYNLTQNGLPVDDRDFSIVWSAPLESNQQINSLVSEFNHHPPAAFPGSKIAVGDVVVLVQNRARFAWLIGANDFIPLFDFEQRKEDKEGNNNA